LKSWFFDPAKDRILSAVRHAQLPSNDKYRGRLAAPHGNLRRRAGLSAASYNRKVCTREAWPILTYIAAARLVLL